MATDKQIQANRRNAQKSTGPKTEEGKAVASLNSITHGFRARSVVLPTEDPAEFAALCERVEAEYQPVGFHEKLLVEQIAVAWWRLARIGLLEQGAYQKTRSDYIDPDAPEQRRLFDVFCKNGRALIYFADMERGFERTFRRSLHDLQQLQASRARRQPAVAPASQPEASPALAVAPDRPPAPLHGPNQHARTGKDALQVLPNKGFNQPTS